MYRYAHHCFRFILVFPFFAAITIGFQLPQYTFQEDEGYVDDVIYVIKQEGGVTEQVLPVVVSPSAITAMPGDNSLSILVSCFDQ